MDAAWPACDSRCMSQPASRPLKVFHADDSPLIRERVAGLLDGSEMAVIGHAETPQYAIEGILAMHPDVVVLDVQLEGGTGLQVLRAVRSVAPDIAFVVFSNHSDPAYRKRYIDEGAQAFLDKSTEFEQLAKVVTQASPSLTH